jgi:hypothetical protein
MNLRRSVEATSLWAPPAALSLDEAVFYTLAYADVFNYPLTLSELHRYLIGLAATPESVAEALHRHPDYEAGGGYYALPGRSSLVSLRERRARIAATMWPRVLAYGRAISRLPFVRMVALTGALSMDNVEPNDDFDFLVVVTSGRVWVARMLIIQTVVKQAARRGDEVCPNFLLAEHALAMQERTLFHAHEVTQMIPLYGADVYRHLRAENQWTDTFLPNAQGTPTHCDRISGGVSRYRALFEAPLRTPLGAWLDRQEMARMGRKLAMSAEAQELSLSPERCKGHVSAHGHMTLDAFVGRVSRD